MAARPLPGERPTTRQNGEAVGEPVDRQPVRVEVDRRPRRVELDRPAVERVGHPREPVGPGVEQRDAEGGAALAVGGQPAALAEQLLPAMRDREADHARAGGERDAQVASMRNQSYSVEAVDALVANLVRSHSADDSSSRGRVQGTPYR